MKVKAIFEFTAQDATGPNPDCYPFELLDSDGDRVAYLDSLTHGVLDQIQNYLGMAVDDYVTE